LYRGKKKILNELIKKDPDEMAQGLELEEIDSLLVLDEAGERWYLIYSNSLGIVGQRTARRQADTIARSGFRMPAGYSIKGNYPMDEITDSNLGDLWKSVQQKYVISDLKGVEIDKETGLPSQLAERKKRMADAGHEDALTEAKFELEEAERRKKAQERSESGGRKTKKKAVKKEKPAKKAKSKKKAKKTKAKKVKAKKKQEEAFFEVEGIGQIVLTGKLTIGIEDPVETQLILDPDNLTKSQWTKIAQELNAGDITQITFDKTNEGTFATSLKV
jgi:hypothetical protein